MGAMNNRTMDNRTMNNRVMSNGKEELLSILMPVYNEEKTLKEIVSRVLKVSWPVPIEIIIVDDFSKDSSVKIMKGLSKKDKRIRCFFHKKNYGKGMAIRTALKESKGTIIVVQDADLEYSPKDLLPMLYVMLNTQAKAVYGSRYLIPLKESYWLFYLGNRFLTFMASLLYMKRITDLLSCYKMFRREAIEGIRLTENGFGFDPEISAKVMKRGHKIYEIPITYKMRTFREGKKVTIRDGLRTFMLILKYRFMD